MLISFFFSNHKLILDILQTVSTPSNLEYLNNISLTYFYSWQIAPKKWFYINCKQKISSMENLKYPLFKLLTMVFDTWWIICQRIYATLPESIQNYKCLDQSAGNSYVTCVKKIEAIPSVF